MTAAAIKARRRPVRALSPAASRAPLGTRLMACAASPAAKTAYIVLGTAGLAALMVAIIGPRRINRQVLSPLRGAVGDQAEKLWDESKDLRRQIGRLFDRAATPAGREKLARDFQSWAGHFRAT